VAQFIARYSLTRMLKQKDQQMKGLVLKLNVDAVLAQFSRSDINFKGSEAKNRRRVYRVHKTVSQEDCAEHSMAS
jgi:hypothetical protein